jgi:hypothetical protein
MLCTFVYCKSSMKKCLKEKTGHVITKRHKYLGEPVFLRTVTFQPGHESLMVHEWVSLSGCITTGVLESTKLQILRKDDSQLYNSINKVFFACFCISFRNQIW